MKWVVCIPRGWKGGSREGDGGAGADLEEEMVNGNWECIVRGGRSKRVESYGGECPRCRFLKPSECKRCRLEIMLRRYNFGAEVVGGVNMNGLEIRPVHPLLIECYIMKTHTSLSMVT